MALFDLDSLLMQRDMLFPGGLSLFCVLALTAFSLVYFSTNRSEVDVSTVKVGSPWLPAFVSRFLFEFKAPSAIYHGYHKFKNQGYRLLRPDSDLTVLPIKYCEELRHLHETKLNSIEALISEHVGEHTTILLGSNIHTDAIQKRLTPRIGKLAPRILDELDYGFETDFPKFKDDEWVPIKPYDMFVRLAARSGSRLFVGESISRDDIWIQSAINYNVDIFMSIALLRPIPGFLHGVVGPLLPSSRRLEGQLKYAQEKLVPIILERRARQQSGDAINEKPDDYLQWLMDLASTPTESDPGNLAHRTLGVLSMAIVHTTAMLMTHVLYDLIMMPEYVEPLREEVGETIPIWKQSSQNDFQKLKRMDSFLKESQRFNPNSHRIFAESVTIPVAFHRVVKEDLVLSDGLRLPKGSHICMPARPITMDPELMSEPEVFDGFRYYKTHNEITSQFVHSGPTGMNFGLGRYACPGRFFAAFVGKAILSRFLMEYDVKFGPEQTGRPKNTIMGDRIVVNTSTYVYIRKRKT